LAGRRRVKNSPALSVSLAFGYGLGCRDHSNGEEILGWIAWIIFGLIAGIIAKFLMPGRDPGGFIVTIILGILGAVVGGWIGTQLGLGPVDGFNLMSFALAVLGAVILLFIYRLIKSRA
jgi:uncharacterized membrane protein YeaQ/YmgE (transglycosylase-associated protein family)